LWREVHKFVIVLPTPSFFKHAFTFTEQNTHVEGEINRRCCVSAGFVAKDNTELNKYEGVLISP